MSDEAVVTNIYYCDDFEMQVEVIYNGTKYRGIITEVVEDE